MKKKSQIRKYTVQKVVQLTKVETIPEMLKMYAQHVEEKNNKLKDKKQQLLGQLSKVRKQSEKIVYQMVDGVKDRLEKTQQIVMTSNSRPSTQIIKQLSDLFTYMQNQTILINNNSNQTNSLYDLICSIDKNTTHTDADYTELDTQFARLQAQCQKQQRQRDRLLAQRDSNRNFYNTIKQTIDEYRVKYDIVQGQIAQREKQLDHLVSYFKLRQQQDQSKINHELETANQMQQQILKAQSILNQESNKNRDLQIQQNQYQSRKSTKNLV